MAAIARVLADSHDSRAKMSVYVAERGVRMKRVKETLPEFAVFWLCKVSNESNVNQFSVVEISEVVHDLHL